MSPTEIAVLVATHLWVTLFVITSVMVLLAWGLWYGLQRWGGRVTTLSREWIGRLATLTVLSNAGQIARGLGIQALISAMFAVFASVVFLEIADEIGADEDLGQFDVALSSALGQHASDVQLRTFALLTHLGDKAVLTPLVIAVALLLIWRRQRFMAAAWVVASALDRKSVV